VNLEKYIEKYDAFDGPYMIEFTDVPRVIYHLCKRLLRLEARVEELERIEE